MNKKINSTLFGAHISVAGGLEKCFQRGEALGCTSIQIFTKSNRQWAAKKITDGEAILFREAHKKSSIKSVIVHASYLINIGSPNPEIQNKSINALIEEVSRCQTLGIPYLVLHPGSKQESPQEECLKLISDNLNYVFDKVPGECSILLENMAGMGSSVAHTFEQLSKIIERVKDKNRIGVCFDTCHAFSAGYNFNTQADYDQMWKSFDDIIGLNKLKALHINDSKKECGSKVDRHANILKGYISKEAFKLLFNDERFFDIPKILETPVDSEEEFADDIKTIVDLIEQKNKKMLIGTNLEKFI